MGNKNINLIDMRFGHQVIIAEAEPIYYTHPKGYSQRHARWLVRCDCGNERVVLEYHLKGKRAVTSCLACKYKASRLNGRLSQHYYTRVLESAAKRSLVVSIDVTRQELQALFDKQKKQCALSGLPIAFAETTRGEKSGESTASLDRIDSSKGYSLANLQWVHKDVNRIKSNMPQDRFLELATLIAARLKGDDL